MRLFAGRDMPGGNSSGVARQRLRRSWDGCCWRLRSPRGDTMRRMGRRELVWYAGRVTFFFFFPRWHYKPEFQWSRSLRIKMGRDQVLPRMPHRCCRFNTFICWAQLPVCSFRAVRSHIRDNDPTFLIGQASYVWTLGSVNPQHST